jgi:DNA-binding phage protein
MQYNTIFDVLQDMSTDDIKGLAAKTGLSLCTIWNLKKRKNVRLDTMVLVSKALGFELCAIKR